LGPFVEQSNFSREFDENGVCTNGTLGPDGYVHLPLFTDVFPYGGLFTAIQENCDPVELADVIQTYYVDGWAMTDNVNTNYWKGYYPLLKLNIYIGFCKGNNERGRAWIILSSFFLLAQ
jgi:hypothetical protein